MSGDVQETFGDALDYPSHLTKRQSAVTDTYAKRIVENDDGFELVRVRITAADLDENEFWCTACNAKVTRVFERTGNGIALGAYEAGHDPQCRHSVRQRSDHDLEPDEVRQ